MDWNPLVNPVRGVIRKESELKYRTIVQANIDGFWLLDQKGNLLYVNEAYCRMSGYTKEELLAMSITEIKINKTSEEIKYHLEKVRLKGSDYLERTHIYLPIKKDISSFSSVIVQIEQDHASLIDVSNRTLGDERL